MQSATTNVLALPEDKVTQPKRQFNLRVNRKGEVVQNFKLNREGNRAQRLQMASFMRRSLRRARLQDRIVDGIFKAHPELVNLADKEVAHG